MDGIISSFGLRLLSEPLPVPPSIANNKVKLPEQTEKCTLRLFKDKRITLSDKNEELEVPEYVGEFILFHFLEVEDIIRVRSVSTQLKRFADASLGYKRSLRIHGSPRFSFDSALNLFDLANKGKRSRSRTGALEKLSVLNCPKFDIVHAGKTSLSLALSGLSVLRIRDCAAFTEYGLKVALRCCPTLQELDSDRVSNSVLDLLNTECNKTASFRILNASGSGHLLSDEGLLSLAKVIRYTSAITCANAKTKPNVLDSAFRFSVDVSSCEITNGGLRSFSRILAAQENEDSSVSLPHFDRRCSIRLDLSDCIKLTSEGIASSMQYLCSGPFIRLDEFRLHGVRTSDRLLLSMAENMNRKPSTSNSYFKSLDLGDCSDISTSSSILGLKNLPHFCEEITSLTMRSCINR